MSKLEKEKNQTIIPKKFRENLFLPLFFSVLISSTLISSAGCAVNQAQRGKVNHTLELSSVEVKLDPSLPADEQLFTALNNKNSLSSLSDFRGTVLLVAFWSTWCPMCGEELKALQAMKHSFKNRDFEVVGVLVEDSPESGREFVKRHHLTMPILVDKERTLSTWADALSIPTVIALDKYGKRIEFIDPDSGQSTTMIQGFRSWSSALGKISVEKLLEAR